MTIQVHVEKLKDDKLKNCNCRHRKNEIDGENETNVNFKNETNKTYSLDPNVTKIPPPAPKVSVCTDDVIGKVCGPFGKWQLRTILLIFLVKIPSSWFMACIIFTAPAPKSGEVSCKAPGNLTMGAMTPMSSTSMFGGSPNWVKLSHPQQGESADHEFKIDYCNIYQDIHDHLLQEHKELAAHHHHHHHPITSIKELEEDLGIDIGFRRPNSTRILIPCEDFEHHSDYESLVTQFDLVCSRDILVSVTQFFHLFGVLNGGCLATFMLKYISPRRVMLIGMITQIICGNLTGWIDIFELHMFFRCLSAVCCALMYTAGGMIFSDTTSGKYKVSAICLFEQFWSIGVMILPIMASFWSSWTQLYSAISLPTILLIISLKWIPESPRWLIKKGKVQEAMSVLMEAAEMNGNLSELNVSDVEKRLETQSVAAMNEPKEPSWWSLWHGPNAKKHLICCHLAWSIYIIIYYGMLLNIRSFGRDYLKVNTAIAGLSEMTGTFIGYSLVMFTTRKWLWTGIINVVAAIIGISANLIPESIPEPEKVVYLMACAMMVKIGISCTLSILTTCTTELVAPEKKRLCGYSTIVWARIWLLTAPFIGALVVYGKLIPQTIMSSMSIVGGILTMFIESPRTIPLPKEEPNSNEEKTVPEMWTIENSKESGLV